MDFIIQQKSRTDEPMSNPLSILNKYWKFGTFRPSQEEIINSVIEGKDTLALLPTGGGKSICFQVPALCMPGLCLVITPLIALMKDQVEQLKKRGISANAIYSGMPRREIDIILDNCVHGRIKFLYVSPERLKTDLFQSRIVEMDVSLLAIDEAHCISQWGYDFRPSYLEIAEIYPLLREVKKIALTATATAVVKNDIIEKLKFSNEEIFQKSFARKNISYSVFELENKEQKVFEILKNVKGSAIIYVRSRKETARIASLLYRNGISSEYYHAGLTIKERSLKQSNWIQNKVRVMVATNAFGMGIDKADVRVVIHFDLPDSLEAYYQEAGRAGRDERNAYAVMLYNPSDILRLKENFIKSFPSYEYLKRVYQSLANFYKLAVGSSQWQSFDFQLNDFSKSYNLNSFETFHAIKKLEEQGLILLNESFYKPSVVMLTIKHEDLYRYCIANAKMEPLIKGLLRLYGGEIYMEFMKINEADLAKLIKSSAKDVTTNLEFLYKSNILVYDKIKEKPQLTFLTPRLDSSKLNINKKELENRKKVVGEKIQSMIDYVLDRVQCRTRIFQEYFDETAYINCGVCDRCIQEKKKRTAVATIENAESHIHKYTQENWMSIALLKSESGIKNDFEFTEGLRSLLDKGLVEFSEDGKVKTKT